VNTQGLKASHGIVTSFLSGDYKEKKQCCDRFKSLADYLPEIVFETDVNGNLTYVNRRAFDVAGYTTEDLEKDVFALNFFATENRERAERNFHEMILFGKPSADEYLLVKKDGTPFPAIVEGIPVLEGKSVKGIRGIVIDLTEIKKRELLLFENQQRFEALFNSNPEAVVYADNEFRIVDFNPVFRELFGFSKEDIIGKTIGETIVPSHLKKEYEQICEILRKGPVQHNTFRKKKDGSLVQVYMSGRTVTTDGLITGIVMVYKDISELILTQKQLSDALKKAELLNEKLDSVGAFTRHDVRNKLAALNGHIYLSKKRANGNEALLKNIENLALISQQIQRILDFEKIYVQVGVEKLRPVDVNKCFEEAVSLHSDLKRVSIANDLLGLKVMADSLLRQIFYNLIDNSLKYGEGVSKIWVHAERKSEKNVCLIYEDNGVGIEASFKERLFQKGIGKGTGYGLYLIRRICDFYGWTVEEIGEMGQGARFVFNIPNESIEPLENDNPLSISQNDNLILNSL
jgi:PAS domain S-box-containing protein